MRAARLLSSLLTTDYCLLSTSLPRQRVGGLPAAGGGGEQAEHLAERFEVVVRQLELCAAELHRGVARLRERGEVRVGERQAHGVAAAGLRAEARVLRERARLAVEHE